MPVSSPPHIRCLVIDDEPLAQHNLIDHIERKSILSLVGTAANALEAQPLIEQLKPDLLFLDIHMPRKSGFELLQSLTMTPMPLVVATTAYSNYALKGYDFNFVHFLEKPIEFPRFEEAVERVQERLGARYMQADVRTSDEKDLAWTAESITLKVDGELRVIPHAQIRYIEALENYVKVILYSGKFVMSKLTLGRVVDVLPGSEFFRISRSHIVRLADIRRVMDKASKVELEGGVQLSVGITFRPLVKDQLPALSAK